MKKLLFPLILLCFSASAQINSFPYSIDFESGQGGWTSGIISGNQNSWTLGSPAQMVINVTASGGNNSWHTGAQPCNEDSYVQSPLFDFTNVSLPVVSLDIWWESEDNTDGAVLQSSIDGGSSWQNVGAFGDDPLVAPNWYNQGPFPAGGGGVGGQADEMWNGHGSNGSQGWLTASHALSGLGGQSNVQLRIAFAFNCSALNGIDGFAFDNVSVTSAPAVDIAMVDAIQTGPCGGGYPGLATISVANLGTTSATITEVEDGLGNTYPITSIVIPSFGSATITISLPLQNSGTPTMTLSVNVLGDPTTSNNSMTVMFDCNLIEGLNHCTGFESDEILTPWYIDPMGVNSSWNLGGNAANVTINTPVPFAGGTNFWATTGPNGTYNSDEQSAIVSPYFDLSNLDNAGVSFYLWWELETDYDGAVFQSSIDGGASWQNIGIQGSGSNWFNHGAVFGGGSGGQNTSNWNGISGSWVIATHSTPDLAGESSVLFRLAIGADEIIQEGGVGFDNFCISGEALPEPPLPKLVINEFSVDDPRQERHEFIEIYNADSIGWDLTDFQVELVQDTNGSGPIVYNEIDEPLLYGVLAPGDYFVIGVAGNIPNLNAPIFSPIFDNLVDSIGAIGLRYLPYDTLVDKVSYNGLVTGYVETSEIPLNEFEGHFDKSFSRLPNGNDTDANVEDFAVSCWTPGEPNDTATGNCYPRILINEYDVNNRGEWLEPDSFISNNFLELYNPGTEAMELDGVRLITGLYTLNSLTYNIGSDIEPAPGTTNALTLEPSGFVAICNPIDNNGTLVYPCGLVPVNGLSWLGANEDSFGLVDSLGRTMDLINDEEICYTYPENGGSICPDYDTLLLSSVSRLPDGAHDHFTLVCQTPGSSNLNADCGQREFGPNPVNFNNTSHHGTTFEWEDPIDLGDGEQVLMGIEDIPEFANEILNRGTPLAPNQRPELEPTLRDAPLNESRYIVRYHEFGNSPNFSYKVVPEHLTSAYVNGLESNTKYVFRIGFKPAGFSAAFYSDTMSVTTKKFCPKPTDIQVAAFSTEATISWIGPNNAENFKLRFRQVGSTSWNYRNTSSTQVQLTGLVTDTDYEFQIRTQCGEDGQSKYVQVQTFNSSTGSGRLAAPTEISLRLFPNPASDNLTLETGSSGAFSIQILNAMGQVIRKTNITDLGNIQVSGLIPGVYSIIATDTNGKSAIGRFIKQ